MSHNAVSYACIKARPSSASGSNLAQNCLPSTDSCAAHALRDVLKQQLPQAVSSAPTNGLWCTQAAHQESSATHTEALEQQVQRLQQEKVVLQKQVTPSLQSAEG